MNMLNYKKLLFSFCLGILFFYQTNAQDNVGIGTTTPNASSILELSATDKGLLVPRLTNAQRDAIATPATGLIIFNTESGTFEYYSGSNWIQLFSGSFLSLTNGRIFVGNASNQAVAVNLSGDATITNTGVLTISNDAITTTKILDANVTNAKLATGIDAAKIADGSISNTEFQYLDGVTSNIQTQLDGKASSTLNNTNIFVGNASNLAVGVPMSGDATITNTGVLTISNDAITTAKILDANVTNVKLATGIDAAKLADGSISNTEFQYLNGVTSNIQTQLDGKASSTLNNTNIFVGNASNLAVGVPMTGDATITNGGVLTIANNAITTAKILDANVTNAKLATGIDVTKLADGTIDNTEFQRLNGVTSNIQTQLDAKMTNALPTGYIYVGNASGVATGVQPSGNISVGVNGALNIGAGQITDAMISLAASINVNKLDQSATNGDLLRTNGSNVEWWTPNFLASGATAGGDLTGTYPNPTIANNAITNSKVSTTAEIAVTKLGQGTNTGDLIRTNGTDVEWWTPNFLASGATAGGDLTGTYPNPTIANNAITNSKVSATAEIAVTKLGQGTNTGDLIRTNGTDVEWWTPNFLASGATAGGDLTGSYPNPTITNNAVTTAKILDGNVTTAKLANNSVDGTKIDLASNTEGDLMYYNGTDWVRLAVGTNNQVLSSNGTIPVWSSAASLPSGTDRQTLRFNGTTLEANSTLLNYGTKLAINYTGTIRDSVVLHIGDGSGNDDDVLIDGDLIVTGTIDPLAIQLVPLSTPPVNVSTAGFMYYNSDSQTIKITNGTGWSDLGSNLTNGLDLKNTDNSAKELKFYEPSLSGTNYTAFKSQAQGGNVTYTLPAADGTDGQVLTTNGSGALSWKSPSASTPSVTVLSSSTTLNSSHEIVLCSGSDFTITLPSAVGLTGKVYTIKSVIINNNYYTIQASSGQTIDGASSKTIRSSNSAAIMQGITLVSDGANWHIISKVMS